MSSEHIAALSVAKKDKKQPNISAAMIGKKHIMKQKKYPKMSAAGNTRFEDPAEHEKISVTLTGRACPWMAGENSLNKRPDRRAKSGATRKGKHYSSISVALKGNPKLIAATTNSWQDPEFVSKQMVARHVFPNKAEILLENILNTLYPGEFKYVGDGKDKQYIIAGKSPDFININGKKQIIELFGEHVHQPEEEQQRIDLFAQHGYQTLVIWYLKLHGNNLIQRITEFAGFNNA